MKHVMMLAEIKLKMNDRMWQMPHSASLTLTESSTAKNKQNRQKQIHLGCISTYKRSGILVHHGTPTHSFAESLLDKLGRGEIRESLSKVYCFVVCSQLCEFNPVDAKNAGCDIITIM